MSEKNGVVEVAKRRATRDNNNQDLVMLSTGIQARFVPVSISIITEAQSAIPDPPVPMWYNEDKDKHEPNPNHPDYAKALERVDEERNMASIDAMIMFGVELVGGLPENKRWLQNLKLRSKLGLSNLDLESFDLDNEIEVEFLYKKYIAVAAADIASVMKLSGVSEEDIAQATKSFQDNKE